MKWLGRLFITLLLLLILTIIVFYVAIQTHWGAKQLSQWLNRQGHYQVSIETISHHWQSPFTLTLSHVDIRDKQSPSSLSANHINIDFKWQDLFTPQRFQRFTLQQGTLTLSGNQFPLVLKADVLQLNQMNIQVKTPKTDIKGENITGGIAPWFPTAEKPFGHGQYQFSANSIQWNGIPVENIVVQGRYQNNTLNIDSFGATFLQGAISGDGQQSPDGSWHWNNLLVSDIRWQSPDTLEALKEKISHLPATYIKDLNITNAKLQGKGWSVDYLDSTIKNLGLVDGSWQAEDGLIDFNAMNITFNDAQFSDTLGKLRFSGSLFTIANLTTHYQKGLFNIQSQWDRKNRQLTLKNSSISGLLYSLPSNWLNYFKSPAPKWISGLTLDDITINNTLLIDTNPHFPLQFTTLAGHVEKMEILKEGKWGLWNGQASLQAAGATFNKIEIIRPYLQLHAANEKITIDKLNAFTHDGLLQITATAEQRPPQTPFSLSFKGMNANLNILPQWGWVPLHIQGEGNFSLAISGDLSADNIKETITGTLAAEDKASNKELQSIEQGMISTNRCSPAARSSEDTNEAEHSAVDKQAVKDQGCTSIKL
ncbi:AsmA family protein [Xenorhabdus sp. 12]|uniref:AsmA family protein n=1 Tax=Xenorhabdus santafensis TaxID=2582833 RepID=A0ABU4S687_9GAMM|nr:AsmA family protein [Xenorhabdus sp. 12]MDX7986163.1 AsmA family protein [Xenorhabdus sp. 12]